MLNYITRRFSELHIKITLPLLILTLTFSACGNPNSGGPEFFDDVKIVSAGGSHTVAIKNNGTLWGWGENTCGQLGNGESAAGGMESLFSIIPVQAGTAEQKNWKWKVASVGAEHTVAIRDMTLFGHGEKI